MASTPTLLNSTTFTVDGTSFATSGWAYTPSTTLLELVLTVVVDDGGGSPAQTLSGCGMTWSAYTDGTTSASSLGPGSRHRVRIFRATSGTPSSGDLTLSTGATTCERAAIALVQVSETTPANAVQVVVGTGTSTAPSATLAAVADAANLILGVFSVRNVASAWTPGSGFTTLANVLVESDTRFSIEYGTNDTSVDGTWASSGQWAGIAVEIDNVPPAADGGFSINGARTGVGGRWRRPAALMGG